MSDFHLNVAICRGCDQRQRPCAGPCACLIDGVDSHRHAKADYCPLEKFGTEKPAQWPAMSPAEIEAMLDAQGYDPETQKECGCCDPPKPDNE